MDEIDIFNVTGVKFLTTRKESCKFLNGKTQQNKQLPSQKKQERKNKKHSDAKLKLEKLWANYHILINSPILRRSEGSNTQRAMTTLTNLY